MMEAAKKMFGCKCNYQRDMDTWGERVRIAWQQSKSVRLKIYETATVFFTAAADVISGNTNHRLDSLSLLRAVTQSQIWISQQFSF